MSTYLSGAPHAETTAPRRLRAQDVIDNLQHTIEQLTTRSSEPYVSVEFTRNAKGETQISTKVSAPGGVDQGALRDLGEVVYAEAFAQYSAACKAWPFSNGETPAVDPDKRAAIAANVAKSHGAA